MLDSEPEALAGDELAPTRGSPEAGDERAHVAVGLEAPGHRPQGVPRLDEVGGGGDGGGVDHHDVGLDGGWGLPGAGEGAGTEQEPAGGDGHEGQHRPPPTDRS